MTEKIELITMGMEHMTKQPFGRRYALFCSDAFKKPSRTDCDSKSRMGHIAGFSEYSGARQTALLHPPDAMIRFYPDIDNEIPSKDFIKNYQIQNSNEIQKF